MKIKNNKISSLLFIAIVAGILSMLIYHTYLSYNSYKERSYAVEHITLIDKIDSLLNQIEKERTYSAIYMGSNSREDLSNLKKYRVSVDIEITNIINFLKKNKLYLLYKSTIQDISKNLDYTRTRVDILSEDYRDILFKNYAEKVSKPLILLVKRIDKEEFSFENRELTSYINLLKLKENLIEEKSFIAFILSASKKISDENLLLWEMLVSQDITESFISTKSLQSIQRARGEVLLNSLTGNYLITPQKWVDSYTVRFDKITKEKRIILATLNTSINAKILERRHQTTKYMLAYIALLFILFILLYIFCSNLKNTRLLRATLSELESDLDEEQREEIKNVLKKNDTIAIYKFLVNAIKEPSRAKDHFLANMSHEIRTPLNGIVGFTNILKETELKEDQREFLSIIEESSNNLISIVNDILDFSKVTSGKVEFENIPFNVMEKFEASIDSYAARAAQKNINLNLFIDPTLPIELMGDATKISQVIINLLSNAVKFTDEYGDINISIECVVEEEDKIVLKFSVKDTGIGMTLEQQSKIFDAFSQADASTSRKFGGTGLGLTISSKFIELMGGKLEVESEKGKGTTFFFSLELDKVEESKSNIIPDDFSSLTVAYITQVEDIRKNQNLERYLDYVGVSFNYYSYENVLHCDDSQLPDILFVDHQYIKSEIIISSLIALDTKVILLTTADIETCNCTLKDKIAKVIYKPLNFSKTIRSLNVTKEKDTLSNQSLTKVNGILSNKVFKNLSALVVEDNLINQKLIQNILEKFDISVTLADNGAEALDKRQSDKFDIIFMDIQMPIMDGVESTQKIIEFEESMNEKHVPIVALTANTVPEDRERYLAVGMDRYLKKPIDVAELTAIIEEFFPIQEIRDSMPPSSNTKRANIILYKETELTAKIYAAVLTNLGYNVDQYSSADIFLEQLDSKEYKFALFDAKPFRLINSDSMIVELIRESGATPIAFVERDNKKHYCETLKPVGDANEISEKLRKCG